MFPSKTMIDYITEMNRLFPRTDDILNAANTYSVYSQSPSTNSTFGNRSSSSADSTSPESYPEVFPRSSELYNQAGTPRRRAIVGRKILDNTNLRHIKTEEETHLNWHKLSLTPPNNHKYDRNYELFPERFETHKPITPVISQPFSAKTRVFTSTSPQPQTFTRYPPQYSSYTPSYASSSKTDEIASSKICTFCRKNGETPLVYMNHSVKEKVGNQHIVTCPILRSHNCTACGATGDNAHTITYCPVMRMTNNGKRLQSTTITLKNTRVKSNGRRRF